MTKKQAYKIIEKEYKDYDGSFRLYCLCIHAPKMLKRDWCKYWDKINGKKFSLVSDEFLGNPELDVLSSLTRLMLLHDFIEDTYE